jgi:hypothetical protein
MKKLAIASSLSNVNLTFIKGKKKETEQKPKKIKLHEVVKETHYVVLHAPKQKSKDLLVKSLEDYRNDILNKEIPAEEKLMSKSTLILKGNTSLAEFKPGDIVQLKNDEGRKEGMYSTGSRIAILT